MAEPEELNADRYVVVYLRFRADMTQAEFGKKSGVNQSDVSKYELGKVPVPEDALRRMAEVADMEWTLVSHLRRFLAALLSAAAHRRAVRGTEPPDLKVLEPVLLAVIPILIEDRVNRLKSQTEEEERREADEIWTALERYPIPRRRQLVEWTFHAARSCALAARICEASAQAADRDAGKARELADFALSIAGRVPEKLRSRAEGYCWAHLANGRRAGGDIDGAEEAFALAWKLWQAGAATGLLPERRMLDLESSLRTAQHR